MKIYKPVEVELYRELMDIYKEKYQTTSESAEVVSEVPPTPANSPARVSQAEQTEKEAPAETEQAGGGVGGKEKASSVGKEYPAGKLYPQKQVNYWTSFEETVKLLKEKRKQGRKGRRKTNK